VSHRIVRAMAVLCIAALAAGPAALAKPNSPKPGGKKPVGEVVSFDAESMVLSVEMKDGTLYEGEVSEDVQVKLEHRGNHDRSGNPSKGTLDDIEAGAKVLRMKVSKKTHLVEKLRLRPDPEEQCEVEAPEGEVEDPEVEVDDPEDPQDVQDCPEEVEEVVVEDGQPDGQ
jgi:hypothetical protein